LYRVSFIVLMVWLGFIFFDKTYTRIRRAKNRKGHLSYWS